MLRLLLLIPLLLWPAAPPDQTPHGAHVTVRPWTEPMQMGVNLDYQVGWDNQGLSHLANKVGAESLVVYLPEWLFCCPENYNEENHFQGEGHPWGNENWPTYQADGLGPMTVVLNGMAGPHTRPGSDNWTAPANLYEPIWSSPGVVNPNNYFARYVSGVATNYGNNGPRIKVYQVWNEPDLSGNWADATYPTNAASWWTTPPNPNDLINWKDSVFAYIRALHVAYEVVKAVDPNAYVAVGGVGYPSFLDALLRYTENPTDGSVTAQYPDTGGVWFDALSFHSYPEWATYADDPALCGQGAVDADCWSRKVTDSDGYLSGFQLKIANMQRVLSRHGYGSTYPAKVWLSTEVGAASKPVGGLAGSPELQRNALLKLGIASMAAGLGQLVWYKLFDTEADSAATSSDAHKGLYYSIAGQTVDSAQLKPAGLAMPWWAANLRGSRFEQWLTLPAASGASVRLADGRRASVAWAVTSGGNENATASVTLPDGQQANLTAQPTLYLQSGTAPTVTPLSTSTAVVQATATRTPTATATFTNVNATATATVTAAAGAGYTLYDDAYRDGWADAGYSNSTNPSNSAPTYRGSASLFAYFNYGSAVDLRRAASVDTAPYRTLRLLVLGPVNGLTVQMSNTADGYMIGPVVPLSGYATAPQCGWSEVRVPLSALLPSGTTRVNAVRLSSSSNSWAVFDDVGLVP